MIESETWHIRDGELVGEPPDSWIYVWRLPEGADPRADVLFVGATNAAPALRTWLHLHSSDKEAGRVAKRFPRIATEPADVYAFRVPVGMERPHVKHALLHALSDAGRIAPEYVGFPIEGVLHPDESVEAYVREVMGQLYPAG
ncbi:hypothetical protein HJ588_04650 [Flexivirga sp. ID2601S]|uniref:GIY-YIG nuclease family protein n=1 Tax=Flexivirga aerilata TaxID=1656889 RepID=A0A849AG72_9MICO|nr:hypothetical protein [Flexivirga aerilata]NNG38566.1 hypothetical protein [Flexivirga aerilata]